jgi:hypothetical protein
MNHWDQGLPALIQTGLILFVLYALGDALCRRCFDRTLWQVCGL